MARGALERETKKKKPFDLPEQAVVLNILRSNEVFQHRFGRLFREHGLTQPQYNILRILEGEGGPLPCLEIADRMITVVPAITRLVDRLRNEGLVEKERSADDGRVWLVRITPAGSAVLRKLARPMARTYRELCGHLTRAECRQLVALLEKARAGA
jgi:DNA-binding MarR family transcriptional regulator